MWFCILNLLITLLFQHFVMTETSSFFDDRRLIKQAEFVLKRSGRLRKSETIFAHMYSGGTTINNLAYNVHGKDDDRFQFILGSSTLSHPVGLKNNTFLFNENHNGYKVLFKMTAFVQLNFAGIIGFNVTFNNNENDIVAYCVYPMSPSDEHYSYKNNQLTNYFELFSKKSETTNKYEKFVRVLLENHFTMHIDNEMESLPISLSFNFMFPYKPDVLFVGESTTVSIFENYSCKEICEEISPRYDVVLCCNTQCAKGYVRLCNPHLSFIPARATFARSSSLPTIFSTLDITGFDTSPKNVQIGDIDDRSKYKFMLVLMLLLLIGTLAGFGVIAAVKCLCRLVQRKKTKHQNVERIHLSENNSITIQQNPLISNNIVPNDHIYCPPNAAPPLPQTETLDKYLDASAQLLSECTHQNVHYEIKPSDISVIKEIGKGNYGIVVKGILHNHRGSLSSIVIAGKTLKCGNVLEETCLRNELNMLLHIGQHCNIIRVIGAVTKPCQLGRFILVNEFCQLGDLENYIKQRKALYEVGHEHLSPIDELNSVLNGNYLCFSALLMYALQIANGAYYYTHMKTAIHRDLALRNVLLTSDHVVKIADFGLAVKAASYDVMHPKPSPSPWYAPECLHGASAVFTAESDVWSYGVILWELFSLAGNVWHIQAPKTKKELLEWIALGNRYEIPKYASQPIAQLMKKCWQFLPENRPNFLQCRTEIHNILFNYSEVLNYISQKVGLEIS